MQLPSNKVGLVLIVVVLVVAGTVFSSTITRPTPVVNLKNVELTIGRDADATYKSGDDDQDGLADWLEEFYHSDPNNPDTDGDGTKDGEEVQLDRDPRVAGPNDPLISMSDMIKTTVGSSTPGSVTDNASIELFSQYLILKKQGDLKPEDEAKLVESISQKVATEALLKDKYTLSNLNIVESNNQTITIYGDRVAQTAVSFFTTLDSYKNLNDSAYLSKVASSYRNYAEELVQITVPTVSQDIHLLLVNHNYKLASLFDVLSRSDADPMTTLVITSQFKASGINEIQLYTSLASYFKNNGIIFDTESTVRFWNNFTN